MAKNILVAVQAVVYFMICVMSILMNILLRITVVRLDKKCPFFAKFKWQDAANVTLEDYAPFMCNFAATFFLALSIYSLTLGICCTYQAYTTSNEQNVGFKVALICEMVLNTIIVILVLVVSFGITFGVKASCNSFLNGSTINTGIRTCADIETIKWKDPKINTAYLYTILKFMQARGWFIYCMCVGQLILTIGKYVLNRGWRPKVEGMVLGPFNAVSTGAPDFGAPAFGAPAIEAPDSGPQPSLPPSSSV